MQDPISVSVRRLNDLSKHLRRRRMEDGALTLASPEVKFQRDRETQDPIDVDILFPSTPPPPPLLCFFP